MYNKKPIIAITIGEASGVGPEILLKALDEGSIFEKCYPLIIGDYKIIDKAQKNLSLNFSFLTISEVDEANWNKINVIDMNNIPLNDFEIGKPNAVTGQAMIDYTKKAVDLALKGQVHGAVGGPHSKKAAEEAGYHFEGYPDLISNIANTEDPYLMLVSNDIRIANVTLHVSLRKAVNMIKQETVLDCINKVHQSVKSFGVSDPKIAVAGLNPHAGESCMFGTEDAYEIEPAVQAAQQKGINVVGPLPADSLFYHINNKKYDAYVAMYHDQAHIPIKVVAFKSASAVAIGVPINWATVDHGCALDIAWKGVADPNVIIETIKLTSSMKIKKEI